MWTFQELFIRQSAESVLIWEKHSLKISLAEVCDASVKFDSTIDGAKKTLQGDAYFHALIKVEFMRGSKKFHDGRVEFAVSRLRRETFHSKGPFDFLFPLLPQTAEIGSHQRQLRALKLAVMLSTVTGRQCYNPLDNIYAFYGLIDNLTRRFASRLQQRFSSGVLGDNSLHHTAYWLTWSRLSIIWISTI